MLSKRATALFGTVLLAGCDQPAANKSEGTQPTARVSKPPEAYFLKLKTRPLAADKVEFNVTTNAPLPIETMADVTLSGVKDDETWIGEERKVTLDRPTTTFVLDTSQNGKRLPSGKYVAEIDYFQRWGANSNPAARELPDMSAKSEVHLGGSGETASHARSKVAMQRWVLGEMDFNRPWSDAELRSKLGPFTCYDSTNAVLSQVCYFPEADLSLFVDRNRHKVFTSKLGRVS